MKRIKRSSITRRALIACFASMLVSVAMLVGTTFAWFTDTASAAVNKIQAGTLDVTLEMADGTNEDDSIKWVSAEGKILEFTKAENAEDKAALWEPGCTYKLPQLRVVNNGNLALEYKILFSAVNTDDANLQLAEVLDVYMGEKSIGTLYGVLTSDNADGYAHGTLAGNTATESIALSVKMREDAGNKYQGLSIGGITVTVLAKQYTDEYDSYSSDYDSDADYYVYPAGVTKDSFGSNKAVVVDGSGTNRYYQTFEQARQAVPDGGTIYLKENTTVAPVANVVEKSITIQGNGADFSCCNESRYISIGTNTALQGKEITIKIHNAKNIRVYGSPSKGGNTWNVHFYNCVNEGCGLLGFSLGNKQTDKINLTVEDCMVYGYTKSSVIRTTADGSIAVKNSSFSGCTAPINIEYKRIDKMDVIVENCTFANCGKIDAKDAAPIRFVDSFWQGTLTVALTNNTFIDTVGNNGDVLLGDYISSEKSYAFTATITAQDTVKVKTSATDINEVKNETKVINIPTKS